MELTLNVPVGTTEVFVVSNNDEYELCIRSTTGNGRIYVKMCRAQFERLFTSCGNAKFMVEECPAISAAAEDALRTS